MYTVITFVYQIALIPTFMQSVSNYKKQLFCISYTDNQINKIMFTNSFHLSILQGRKDSNPTPSPHAIWPSTWFLMLNLVSKQSLDDIT